MVVEDVDPDPLFSLFPEDGGHLHPGLIIAEYIELEADELFCLMNGIEDGVKRPPLFIEKFYPVSI